GSFGNPAINPNHFTGGGGFGYNVQFATFFGGIEADLQYLGLKGSNTVQINTSPCGCVITPYTWSQDSQADWAATLRLRAGLAFQAALLYVTGGLAMADQTTAATLTFPT